MSSTMYLRKALLVLLLAIASTNSYAGLIFDFEWEGAEQFGSTTSSGTGTVVFNEAGTHIVSLDISGEINFGDDSITFEFTGLTGTGSVDLTTWEITSWNWDSPATPLTIGGVVFAQSNSFLSGPLGLLVGCTQNSFCSDGTSTYATPTFTARKMVPEPSTSILFGMTFLGYLLARAGTALKNRKLAIA